MWSANGLEQVRVVLDSELIGHGEQQRVGLADGRVAAQIGRDLVGLADVALAEARERPVEVSDLVGAVLSASDRRSTSGRGRSRSGARFG